MKNYFFFKIENMCSPCNVLIFGDICGQWDHAVSIVEKVNERNGPWGKDVKNGKIEIIFDKRKLIPLPCYFIVSSGADFALLDEIYSYVENEKKKQKESQGDDSNNNANEKEKETSADIDEGFELCQNLHYLGRFGMKTLRNNGRELTVSYLSGMYDVTQLNQVRFERTDPFYRSGDIRNGLKKMWCSTEQ
ncbi:hypothetical protein RFI_27890, partial [Reticulomyxa filosa]